MTFCISKKVTILTCLLRLSLLHISSLTSMTMVTDTFDGLMYDLNGDTSLLGAFVSLFPNASVSPVAFWTEGGTLFPKVVFSLGAAFLFTVVPVVFACLGSASFF